MSARPILLLPALERWLSTKYLLYRTHLQLFLGENSPTREVLSNISLARTTFCLDHMSCKPVYYVRLPQVGVPARGT